MNTQNRKQYTPPPPEVSSPFCGTILPANRRGTFRGSA